MFVTIIYLIAIAIISLVYYEGSTIGTKIYLGIFWIFGISLIVRQIKNKTQNEDKRKKEAQMYAQNNSVKLLLLGIFGTIGDFIFIIIYIHTLTLISRPSIFDYFVLLIAISALLASLYFILNNAGKVYHNIMTSLHGEIYYGKVIKIYKENKAIFNEKPEYIADLIICNPLYNYTEVVSERIGASSDLFTVNKYYKLKYFNNDINILEEVNKKEIPKNIIAALNK